MKGNNLPVKMFLAILLAILLTSVHPANAQGLPKIVVIDHLTVNSVGQTFNASIYLNLTAGTNVTNLKGWEIKMSYNTTLLDCLSAQLLPGHPLEGLSIMNPAPTIDETAGTVLYMCITVQMNDCVNVTTTKPLCNILFNGTAAGTSPLTLIGLNTTGGTYMINKDGLKISFEAVSGDVTVIPEFALPLLITLFVATATIACVARKKRWN